MTITTYCHDFADMLYVSQHGYVEPVRLYIEWDFPRIYVTYATDFWDPAIGSKYYTTYRVGLLHGNDANELVHRVKPYAENILKNSFTASWDKIERIVAGFQEDTLVWMTAEDYYQDLYSLRKEIARRLDMGFDAYSVQQFFVQRDRGLGIEARPWGHGIEDHVSDMIENVLADRDKNRPSINFF